MENSIFRKKSLDRISSPEQLNDYIKVSNPSVWIVLGSVIIFFIAAFIWSISGNITSQINTNGVFTKVQDENYVLCYVSPAEAAKIKSGMEVRLYDLEINSQAQSSLNGTVVGVNPASEEVSKIKGEITDGWTSEKLTSNLQEGYGNQVFVKIEKDSNSSDGYKWTGEAAHSLKIEENGLCRVEIIKESITPIKFIIG